MAAALNSDESLTDEIDMERVVADAEYRRRIISRLRRERRSVLAQTSAEESADAAGGEED
jgi:hypothetical protein